MESFLSPDAPTKGRSTSRDAVARALRGMAGESKGQGVARLVDGGVCKQAKAYALLTAHPHVVTDKEGKLWWREELE